MHFEEIVSTVAIGGKGVREIEAIGAGRKFDTDGTALDPAIIGGGQGVHAWHFWIDSYQSISCIPKISVGKGVGA